MRIFLAACLALLFATGCAQKSHYLTQKKGVIDMYLYLPDADRVQLATSLDNFRLHDARRLRGGQWLVSVVDKGEYSYFYRVNGTVFVPDCPYREFDDFGAINCRHRQ